MSVIDQLQEVKQIDSLQQKPLEKCSPLIISKVSGHHIVLGLVGKRRRQRVRTHLDDLVSGVLDH